MIKFPQSLTWLIRLAVLTSMGLCIGSDIYRITAGPRRPVNLVKFYGAWDDALRHATQNGRGLFIKFDRFPGGTRSEAFAQTIYYRGVYVLYPLPVVVTGQNVAVNQGKQILADNSCPSVQWLADHRVGSVMTVAYDEARGQPYVESVQWVGN
jgi:hypothetical protein